MIKQYLELARLKFMTAITNAKPENTYNDEDIKQVKEDNSEKRKGFPASFFYGDGQFQPIYYFIFVFCHLGVIMIALKLYGVWLKVKDGSFVSEDISTGDIATVLGFAGSILTLYNFNRNKKPVIIEDRGKERSEPKKGKGN